MTGRKSKMAPRMGGLTACLGALVLTLHGGVAQAFEGEGLRQGAPVVLSTWHQAQKVLSVAQTPDGFLWAATDSGLLRFDGVNFVPYTTGDGLRGNIVHSLSVGPSGVLWVGLAGGHGIASVRGRRVQAIDTGETLRGVDAEALVATREQIWIGTSRGLFRYTPASQTLTGISALTSQSILAIERVGETIWAGTRSGLFRIENDEAHEITVAGASLGPILAIASDAKGTVWFSASRHGLMRVTVGSEPTVITDFSGSNATQPQEARSIGFTAMTLDGQGRLWVGWSGGYGIWDGKQIAPRFTSQQHIVDLLSDREGGMWVATYWGRVYRVGVPRVRNVVFSKEGGNPILFSVTRDHAGDLWAALPDGLVHVQPDGEIKTYRAGKDLPLWCPRSLSPAKEGGVWLGSCDGGVIAQINGDRVRAIPAGADEVVGQAIFEDRNGTLWYGTEPGDLYRRVDGVLVRQDFPNGNCGAAAKGHPPLVDELDIVLDECAYSVVDLSDARDGGLWLALRRNGLRLLRDGQWREWTTREGLPTNNLNDLFEDRQGVLWIGTQGNGLIRYDGKEFKNVEEKDGLPAQSVHGIVEDDQERLWMSTERGILRVDKQSLNAFFAGKASRIEGVAYDTRDGLETVITMQNFPGSITLLPNGRVAVPMDRGLGVVESLRVEDTVGFANVVLEDVRINGSGSGADAPGGMPGLVDLPVGTSHLGSLEFAFNVPNFEVPHRIDVRYRLVGHDQDWLSAGKRRVVRYENLAPGSYHFETRPALDGNMFGDVAATDTLRVRSFYQRPAFLVLLGLMLLPLAGGVYLVRMRYQQARFNTVLAERNRIARDLHDSLAQYFTGLSYQLERLGILMRKDPDAADEINQETKLMLQQCRLEARQAIHNMRSEDMTGAGLAESLRALAAETRISGTASVEVHAEGEERRLPLETKRELLRIAQEATVNALTHAKARHIAIEVLFASDAITLSIEDDGSGFDPEHADPNKPLHFGMQGMRERALELGGQLTVESEASSGTRVEVHLKTGA